MPQTMLALLAMMVVMLLTVNQNERIVHLRQYVIRNEIAMQANAVAVDRLEEIGAMAFDEATIDDKTIHSKNELTAYPFDVKEGDPNDIDDFQGAIVPKARVVNGRQLWFRVASTVSYAKENDPDVEVTGPTRLKKVTVTVQSDSLNIPTPTITLSQTFACGSRCDW